ncbi:hypothetical protein [Vulcanisaeta distributa]|uniref:Uncharacterized protein n=1 Tax=Vulcanisaeta distributa (strain DSM 14429 / JCM 11212 / NBRC 100878 / IC-017) TaxID=572478 RepID=E1QTI5_VULDI|nr:hypothetical protein [Vulcanisaeta distributa]ADN49700.1 conserved hypothetical protein [Vulcanisaeta distributa DSM 14429]
MYVVFGVTSGMSSVVFEGRYKGPNDVRDVHVSDVPRINHVLHSFVITNDVNDFVIWTFDIPGYETHIYSMIKERATLLLCPRIDNSTYLLPDASLVNELNSMLYKDARSATYFVRPTDRSFVSKVLRDTVSAARALIMEKVSNLLRSRGLATIRLMDELGGISDDMITAAKLWASKGFANEVDGVYSMVDYVRSSLELKRSRSRR